MGNTRKYDSSRPSATSARILGVGTAVPATSYTQTQILDEFAITDPRIRSVFMNSAIERRGLSLPPVCIIPEAVDAMRYDWDDEQGKFSFYLDPEIPYVVGAHAELSVDRLLDGSGLGRSDISHWVAHSGGKKVIDSIRANLGLSRHDVRHTIGVLRDHGNLSSGSFLFSYARLRAEGRISPGEFGVFMTMGPAPQSKWPWSAGNGKE